MPTLAEIQAAARGNADHGSADRTSSDSLGSMLRFLEKVEEKEKNLKRKGDGEKEEGGEKKKQKGEIVNASC